MKFKLLLFAIVALAITSCSTAYKSGQTPDDVYYSPAKFEENRDAEKDDDRDQVNQQADERRDRQRIRDRRWRDFNDYDYTYNNSPYNHCYCNCPTYGYYYNPYYNSAPIYTTTTIKNTTPRKVNLNSYQGYNTVKTTTPTKMSNPVITPKYNNSNKKESFGSKIVKIFTSRETNSSNTESSSSSNSNNTRSYTPSSSSSSSSSGGSGGGSVSRPSRGGQ